MNTRAKFVLVVSLAVTLILSVLNAYAATKTFQQGFDGYTSCVDTMLNGETANTRLNHYGASYMLGIGGTVPGYSSYVSLMYFGDLYGDDPNQIPVEASIQSATLKLWAYSAIAIDGNGNPTVNAINAFRMKTPWYVEAVDGMPVDWKSCWSYRCYRSDGNYDVADCWGNDGLAHNGPVEPFDQYWMEGMAQSNSIATLNGSYGNNATEMTLNLPASWMNEWKDGDPDLNRGLYLANSNGSNAWNGIHVYSADASGTGSIGDTVNYRPKLTVQYVVALIRGAIVLPGYSGDMSQFNVPFEIRHNGTLVWSGKITLGVQGQFETPIVAAGTYDVTIRFPQCLVKTLSGVVVGTQDTDIGTITLKQGDMDGNNSLGSTDLSILATNYGSQGQ